MAFALLPFLPVAGRVYTADALHTHPPFFQRIQALHGHTVLMVKGNQPTLQEHLVTYFADPLASFEQACTIDLQRGRKEVRSLKVTAALNEYLQQDWPGVAQVAQLTRTVTVSKTAETTTEVVYLITTLTREQASPERLLELVRGHWCIENRSHYVRDVTFQEDRSRCALAMLLRSWLPCAIWLLPLSIVMVLLRLLLPDVLSALTLSVPALGFSIHKRPSSTCFPSKEDAHPILTTPLWLLPARDSIHRASLASLCFLASPRSPSAFLCFPLVLPFSGFFLTLLCPPRIHKPCLYVLMAMTSLIYLLVFLGDNHDRNIKNMFIVPLVFFLSYPSMVIEAYALIIAYWTVDYPA